MTDSDSIRLFLQVLIFSSGAMIFISVFQYALRIITRKLLLRIASIALLIALASIICFQLTGSVDTTHPGRPTQLNTHNGLQITTQEHS